MPLQYSCADAAPRACVWTDGRDIEDTAVARVLPAAPATAARDDTQEACVDMHTYRKSDIESRFAIRTIRHTIFYDTSYRYFP
jgi:hypothetical protein